MAGHPARAELGEDQPAVRDPPSQAEGLDAPNQLRGPEGPFPLRRNRGCRIAHSCVPCRFSGPPHPPVIAVFSNSFPLTMPFP